MEIKNLKNEQQYLKTINKWLYNQWGHHDPDNNEEDWLKAKKKKLNDNKILPIRFVAIEEGEPVGTASIVKHDMRTHTELEPWMADVYVIEEKRKQGIGTKLIKKILKEARKQNFGTLYLFTPDKKSFYEELDWSPFFNEQYRGENVDIMVYNL